MSPEDVRENASVFTRPQARERIEYPSGVVVFEDGSECRVTGIVIERRVSRREVLRAEVGCGPVGHFVLPVPRSE